MAADVLSCQLPCNWTSTCDFGLLLNEIGALGDVVVTAPEYGFWRDGFIAFQTAQALGASHVRLIAEPQPDFAVRVGTNEYLYEATELLRPERRRHDEYRATAASGNLTQDDPEEHWIKAEDFLAALQDRATSKSEKNYPLGCHLVIYINVGWISSPKSISAPLEQMFGIEALRDAVRFASEQFERINLIHRGALITL